MIRVNKQDQYSIKFRPKYNTLGEKIIGDFYDIGNSRIGSANAISIDQPEAVEGALVDTEISFPLDFSSLEEERVYGLVLRTAETGVIHKEQIYVNYGFN